VDGGDTKTIALALRPDGSVVGTARCGSTYFYGIGWSKAFARIDCVVREAVELAGGRLPVLLGHAGLAGIDWPEDTPRALAGLEAAGAAKRWTVDNDTFNLLPCGTGVTWGAAISIGTGTNIGARAPDGRSAHGGAYLKWGNNSDLVHAAVGAVYHAYESRGPATMLSTAIPAAMHMANDQAFLRWWTNHEDDQRARHVMKPLMASAAAGDPEALKILRRLAPVLAGETRHRLGQVGLGPEVACEVVLGGSVGLAGNGLLARLTRPRLRHVLPNARLELARVPAAGGAALLALAEWSGGPPDAQVRRRLEETLPPPDFFRS
jgi:N-acetylglucosamine kinase-like BadF-type ATPase